MVQSGHIVGFFLLIAYLVLYPDTVLRRWLLRYRRLLDCFNIVPVGCTEETGVLDLSLDDSYLNCARKLRTTRNRLGAHPASLTERPQLLIAPPRRISFIQWLDISRWPISDAVSFHKVDALSRLRNYAKNMPPPPKKKIASPFLTLYLLTWKIWWTPNNVSKWQVGFNWAFKGLKVIKHKHINFERNFAVASSRHKRVFLLI
jgi:hypothetical protein